MTEHFTETMDADPGPGTSLLQSSGIGIYLIKFDGNGQFLWAKSYDGLNSTTYPSAFCIDDSANLYFTGYFNKTAYLTILGYPDSLVSEGGFDAFVIKMDSSGGIRWARSFGESGAPQAGSDDIGHAITLDVSGNIYVNGYFWNEIDFSSGAGTAKKGVPGKQSGFLLKLSAIGQLIWVRAMPSTRNIYGWLVQTDDDKNVYILDINNGSTEFDPGNASATINEMNSTWCLAKYDQLGNFIWVKKIANYTQSLCISGKDIFTCTSDTVYYYNSAGSNIWQKKVGPNALLTSDNLGNLYCYGTFRNPFGIKHGNLTDSVINRDTSEIYMIKLNHQGDFTWVKLIGSLPGHYASEFANDLFVDDKQNIYASGRFAGNPDFNPGTDSLFAGNTSNSSMTRTFLLKLDASLNPTGFQRPVQMAGIKIYPNPGNGIVNLELDTELEKLSAVLFNLQGKRIKEFQLNSVSNQLDITECPSGVYFLSISDKTGFKKTVKIVKE